jgi:hypothetical protein
MVRWVESPRRRPGGDPFAVPTNAAVSRDAETLVTSLHLSLRNADSQRHAIRRPRSAGLLALAMALGVAVEADPILARADNPRACSTTTAAQFEACRHEAGSDFFACGEAVSNFETFPGDNPVRPERVSTDGQWKTGRDGVPSGAYILGSPKVGDVHRSEFAPGVAEDTVRYLSTSYGYGTDPGLDQNVPRALIDLFCGSHDCWVTLEFTGIEPGAFTRKYYARGVGFILGVDQNTAETVQLVGCNFDQRCANLPTPGAARAGAASTRPSSDSTASVKWHQE